MEFIKDKNGKIVRRVINKRAYIEDLTLFVDGKPFGKIGGTFDMREAIRTGKLFV